MLIYYVWLYSCEPRKQQSGEWTRCRSVTGLGLLLTRQITKVCTYEQISIGSKLLLLQHSCAKSPPHAPLHTLCTHNHTKPQWAAATMQWRPIVKQWAVYQSSLCLYQCLRLAPMMIIICLVSYGIMFPFCQFSITHLCTFSAICMLISCHILYWWFRNYVMNILVRVSVYVIWFDHLYVISCSAPIIQKGWSQVHSAKACVLKWFTTASVWDMECHHMFFWWSIKTRT